MQIYRTPFVIGGKPQEWAKGTGVIGARGFVFLSGSVGMDINTGKLPEGAGEQAKLAMENIKAMLAQYSSSLKNIMHMWLYVVSNSPNGIVDDPKWQETSKAMQEFWRENCPEFLNGNNPPAETLLGVASLALPGQYLEIMVIAAIS